MLYHCDAMLVVSGKKCLDNNFELHNIALILQWYYFFCFQNTSPGMYATPLKWAVTEPGKSFLMSGKWAADVTIASRLYQGNAGTYVRTG